MLKSLHASNNNFPQPLQQSICPLMQNQRCAVGQQSPSPVEFPCRSCSHGSSALVESTTSDVFPRPFVVTVIDAESNSAFLTTTATADITSELTGTSITCEHVLLTKVEVATLPDITGITYYLMACDITFCTCVGEACMYDSC